MEIVTKKYAATVPVSVELMFDITPWAYMPLWMKKEYLQRGYGMGRDSVSCRWPRPRHEDFVKVNLGGPQEEEDDC